VALKPVHRWSDPLHVVALAVQQRQADRRAATAADDSDDVFDGVWAVVDIDTHAHLLEAMSQAARNGIAVAISGPCFETWLILHLEDRTAEFSTPKAAKDHWVTLVGPAHAPEQGFTKIEGQFALAIRRAAALTSRHEGNGIPRHRRNPSSEVGVLVATVCAEAGVDPDTL